MPAYRLTPAQPGDDDLYHDVFVGLCLRLHPAVASIMAHDVLTVRTARLKPAERAVLR